MKIYIDRNAVLEILQTNSSLQDAKTLVEKLPVTTIDDGWVIQAETATIACNIENLTL